MKTGDVIFYKGTSLISRLIRLFTKSEYTHVALAVGDKDIIESQRFIKTSIRELKASEEYEVFRVDSMTDQMRKYVFYMALSHKDTPYDYFQILGIAFEAIFGRENFFNSTNKLICSELIDIVFYASGVPRKLDYPYNRIGDVTPHELFEVYNLRKVDN